MRIRQKRRLFGIPTPPADSENQGSNLVRPAEPKPKVIYSAVLPPEPQPVDDSPDLPSFSPLRVVAILIGVMLLMALLAGGLAYWMESHRYPVVVTIGLPDNPAQKDPLAGRPGPLVPISPDMVHVSSIALGTPRLTIANGKRLAEGDWLVVNAPLGAASLRVISIQDGLVRFKHGGETIDVRLQAAAVKPLP